MCKYIEELSVLQQAFAALNKKYFGNQLEPVVITIQSDLGAYGHYTCGKLWKTQDGETQSDLHEINFSAETLNRHYYNTVATLLHEMVHHYCYQNGIKDTSRQGRYHNKEFKKIAEERGLIISYASSIGWSLTEPTEKLKEFVDSLQLDFKKIYRETPIKEPKDTPQSKIFKYKCPVCGMKIRTSKQFAHLQCMDCDEELQAY